MTGRRVPHCLAPARLGPLALGLLGLALLGLSATLATAQDRAPAPEQAPAASAEEEPEEHEGRLQGNLRELESWLVLEEEIAPEPPLLRLEVGFVGFIESRSRVRADRRGVAGTRLGDLEEEQGLETSGLGPYLSFSLGGKVRGGGEAFQFVRGGELTRQAREVVFDGFRVAEPGDYLEARFEFSVLSAFVEWDLLYGQTYRIGLIGGLRYFRLDLDLASLQVRGGQVLRRTGRVDGELLSPSFGGLIELTPFPYLTVFTQFQFMNWSWRSLELADASYFDMRLGGRLNVIPGVLSISLEYRFLAVQAVPSTATTGAGRLEGALIASGLGFTIGFSF